VVNPDINSNELNPLWRELLSGEDPRLRRGRQMFRLLSPTARERCRLCCAGFDGFSAPLMRAMGRKGGNYQFTALGDPMNFAARLVGAAKAGEMLMSEAIWSTVSKEVAAEPRTLELKGYTEPQKAYVTKVGA